MTTADFQGAATSTMAIAGWRIPFLVSILLLAVSVWIRMQLAESPAFLRMKEQGTHSRAPLSEAFGQWSNAKWAILALLGMVMGQAVVWYSGQFYALFFLLAVLKVDGFTGNMLVAWSLALGTGGFILFGWLSDKIGRKPIILGGCLIAAVTYFTVFRLIAETANPASGGGERVGESGGHRQSGGMLVPVQSGRHGEVHHRVRRGQGDAGSCFGDLSQEDAPPGTPTSVRIGDKTIDASSPTFAKDLADTLTAVGYPAASNPSVVKLAHAWDIFRAQPFTLVLLLTFLVILVTMVYGPIAAALVELFPTRIRYTSMSLPYHIGNGWFGGLLPATVFAMNAQTGSLYYGLWYPIVIAGATVIIGLIFLPETKDRDIFVGDMSMHPGDREIPFEPMAPSV